MEDSRIPHSPESPTEQTAAPDAAGAAGAQLSPAVPEDLAGVSGSPARPVGGGQRIQSLDVLRGVAVLGILVMNIQAFGQISMAYANPTAYGDFTGLQKALWVVAHVFFEQKFLSVFSILFGAGVYLMTRRAEDRGEPSLGLHLRRMMWLALIGWVHGYLFWWGDILFSYAICGMLIYFFRNLRPRTQAAVGLVLMSVCPLLMVGIGLTIPYWPEETHAASIEQWSPPMEVLQEEIGAYRGPWAGQLVHRIPATFEAQTFGFFFYTLWRVLGMMFLGMALFRWGLLSGTARSPLPRVVAVAGLGLGLPLVAAGVVHNMSRGFHHDFALFFGFQYNYWGSVLVALGYIAIIVAAARASAKFAWLMAPVGRMALTNYLLQTLICTTVFYGHGLGWFASLNRGQMLLVVLAVWTVEIVLSHWWLARYRFGPFEWLWRSLTYRRLQTLAR